MQEPPFGGLIRAGICLSGRAEAVFSEVAAAGSVRLRTLSVAPGVERCGFFFDFTSSILAKVLVRCYLSGMELLEKLETQVAALLARLDRLRAENERISAESAVLGEEKAALEDENHRLREALENEEQLRAHALKRIDAVLRNIQEHDSVE